MAKVANKEESVMEVGSKLAQAVLNVMKAVDSVEKGMTVGNGEMAYKGVSDAAVKQAYRKAMIDNGLVILPIDIQEQTDVDRWVDSYGKPKQSIFTKVKTQYKLLHVSGEYEIIQGYGHGIDSQDKGAGKSTTYAMKYALLYTFMTPTLNIDDSDVEHSDDKDTPPLPQKKESKPWINEGDKNWVSLLARKERGDDVKLSVVKQHFNISKENEEKLIKIIG
jgi:hypothetical protein